MEIFNHPFFDLSKEQLQFLEDYCKSLTFDWVSLANELTVHISPYKGNSLGGWVPDLEVLVEGKNEEDERGNGCFGFHIDLKDINQSLLEV